MKIELVGFSTRLPGAKNYHELWDLLKNGKCTVSEIPDDRWSKFHYGHPRKKEVGKSYTFAAGVLDDVWKFDPSVFGISPREAEQMDPQQRILLESTWEALEDAGIAASKLAGENVGVYVGASALDYANLALYDPSTATGHFMTGNTLSIISNRLSYAFDFTGPSLTVDTACSSSLVALHQAVEALSSGRIDTAIVAGVNVLASPFPFVGFAQATMLSPEGLCRAFDKNGFGYVRAEGCVCLVLRRSDVQRWPGQRSHANIDAVDVNSDGRTVGLSLPSSEDQAKLIERIYRDNGIDPNQLAFVEAHGTGTLVGDPAEAISIGNILGRARENILPIGSIKTNIGHLEPASGLAGLVKSVLALKHDYLPASLHFDDPNPDIDFDGLNIEVAKNGRDLVRNEQIRYAGINNFGFGGTNAHVIISDPNSSEPSTFSEDNGLGLLFLSAQTELGLAETAQVYLYKILNMDPKQLNMFLRASYHRKDKFRERLVIFGDTIEDYTKALVAFVNKETLPENVIRDTKKASAGLCAFVFSGNGAQWPGMGRNAYETNAHFKKSFDNISDLFETHLEFSLSELLFSEDLDDKLELTSITQPLIFAVQISLCDALSHFGISPKIVFGHSIGEIAAAVVSNKIKRTDAVKLVCSRSISQELAAGTGGMGALVLSEEETQHRILDGDFKDLEIAAINSHKSVTLSGSNDELERFAKYARKQKLIFRNLKLNYPFHSKRIDLVEGPFKKSLKSINSLDSNIVMLSTVYGTEVGSNKLNIDYWWQNLRKPVQFHAATQEAIKLGVTFFLEIGPKPVLQSYLQHSIAEADISAIALPSLGGESTHSSFDPVLRIIALAVASGVGVDEAKVFGDNPNSLISLPNYVWQRDHYLFSETGDSNRGLIKEVSNPLLGWRAGRSSNIWLTHLDPSTVPFLADHVVHDKCIFPGAGYVEIALAVARVKFGTDTVIEIQSNDIVSAMYLSDQYLTEVKTVFDEETGSVEISSRRRNSDDDWLLNSKCRVFKIDEHSTHSVKATNSPAVVALSGQEIYDSAATCGLNFGPSFQQAKLITHSDDGCYRVQLKSSAEKHKYEIHPANLDGCFHGLLALFAMVDEKQQDRNPAYIPIYFDRITHFESGVRPDFAEIRIRKFSPLSILADFDIFSANGQILAKIEGGRFRAADLQNHTRPEKLVYRVTSEIHDLMDSAVNVAAPTSSHLHDVLNDAGFSFDNEESESRLLLDAGVQVFANEILDVLFKDNDEFDTQKIPAARKSYYLNALSYLTNLGELEETEEGLFRRVKANNLPSFNLLLNSIVADSPFEIASVTLLCLARSIALSDPEGETEFKPSGAMLDHFNFSSPDALIRKNVALNWLSQFVKSWPTNKPLRILDLAGSGQNLATAILNEFPETEIRISILDSDSSSSARLANSNTFSDKVTVVDVSKGMETLSNEVKFDVVISSGRLHTFLGGKQHLSELRKFLSEGAKLAAFEPLLDDFYDFTFGLGENWFAENSLEGFPIGLLKTSEEWNDEFNNAGFGDVLNLKMSVDGTNFSSIAASSNQESISTDATIVSGNSHWTIFVGDDLRSRGLAEHLRRMLGLKGQITEQVEINCSKFDASLDDNWQKIRVRSEFLEAEKRYLINFTSNSELDSQPLDSILLHTMPIISLAKDLDGINCVYAAICPGGSGLAKKKYNQAVPSSLWTFTRVLANELQNLNVKSIDMDLDLEPANFLENLLQILDSDSGNEFVVDQGNTYLSRVERGFSESKKSYAETATLQLDGLDLFDDMNWQPSARHDLEPHEVEIEVAATGLNFRDVMWSMRLLPEEALEDGYGGASMGLECSGRVVNIGSKVKHLAQGDQVVAFTTSGFSNHVKVPEFAVAKIPDNQDLVAAATLPVAFITTYYSLIHLGNLRKDQWLLLHGAAGGVGLAALQIAKWMGAKVIATAGSDEKRELLKVLGADYVLNSRSLTFAEQVKKITGEGVHLVLNSLAGEAMERGINSLRPFGRFLELGKRDYYGNTKIGLRPFRRNISYFGIDLDQLLLHDQELATKMMKEVFDLVSDGTFVPLPHRVFESHQILDAFRLMQRAGQVGKILICPPGKGTIVSTSAREKLSFDENGAHLVIGGLGGFGGEITRWLADHGARTIILTSRSGLVSADHEKLINLLKDKGINVQIKICDVTQYKSVKKLLEDIRKDRPIKSVIHSAMVIDDGMMTSLNSERFEKVLAPKVLGAQHLNQLTWQDSLDHFILFSSATTLIGNPGQSHYVAANGYLEGMIRERHKSGRHGIAVGWGAIGDVGFLARNKQTSEKLARHLGEATIDARKGLDILAQFLTSDDINFENSVLHIGRFDWATAHQALPVVKSRMFEGVVENISSKANSETKIDLNKLVAGKSDEEALKIILHLLNGEISTILRVASDDIDLRRPLVELGMDSLMGLELRMSLQERFGLEMPLMSISGTTSLNDIAHQIFKSVQINDEDSKLTGPADHLALASRHLNIDALDAQKQIVLKNTSK